MKLQDKVALVFGGASGLGRASAEACAADGASVLVADVDVDNGQEVVAKIRASGSQADFIKTDITKESDVRQAVETAVRLYGGLDILVTSAGSDMAEDQGARWDTAIDLYLNGPALACKYAIEQMKARRGGSIVNISSIAGVVGSVGKTVDDMGYPAAKHGIIGLTKTIALAHAGDNIRANAICPGYIKSGLTQPLYAAPDGGKQLISETLRVPMNRWGEAHEIGKVVAFLASEDASYITGQPIVVDGGLTAR
jgi:NAD(P)-dependent dehydrogenase (short-subunit alcohol dehydrogenase family)